MFILWSCSQGMVCHSVVLESLKSWRNVWLNIEIWRSMDESQMCQPVPSHEILPDAAMHWYQHNMSAACARHVCTADIAEKCRIFSSKWGCARRLERLAVFSGAQGREELPSWGAQGKGYGNTWGPWSIMKIDKAHFCPRGFEQILGLKGFITPHVPASWLFSPSLFIFSRLLPFQVL